MFCTIFISSFPVIAQKNKDATAILDTSAFKGKLLLNNSIRLDKFFDPFREKIKKVNANKEVVLDLPAYPMAGLPTRHSSVSNTNISFPEFPQL